MKTIVLRKEKIHSGNLILVNARRQFQAEKINNLAPADLRYPSILLNRDAANVLQLIFDKLSAGNSIVPISGYRSLKEQKAIYNNSLTDNGADFTRKFVALPNHSEHQTGLAIDLALNKKNIDFICPEFPYNGVCEDFRRLAPHYGFIERYQKDKEKITGISHEPWHFRYVGFPHSKIIRESNLSLEEYIDFIKNYPDNDRFIFQKESKKKIEIYYTPAENNEATLIIPEKSVYQVSGNNVDGFITTVWRSQNE